MSKEWEKQRGDRVTVAHVEAYTQPALTRQLHKLGGVRSEAVVVGACVLPSLPQGFPYGPVIRQVAQLIVHVAPGEEFGREPVRDDSRADQAAAAYLAALTDSNDNFR